MRKKFLKAAIAAFAISFTAAFGFLFTKPIMPKTPTTSAATTTGLSDWSKSSSGVTLSGDTATISGGGYLYLSTSSDYSLTFTTTRSTTGAELVGGARSLLVGMNVASPSDYTSGAWLFGSVDQNSNLIIDGASSTAYYGNAAATGWVAQNGQMTLTVEGGKATLTHATHGPAYVNVPVDATGYISFYVPTGAGDATISGVSYTEIESSGGGEGGGSSEATGLLVNDFEGDNYGYTIDTGDNGAIVNGARSTEWVSQGTYSNKLTPSTQWYTVYLSVGTMSESKFRAYDSISFDAYSLGTHNWHNGGTVFANGVGGTKLTVTTATANVTFIAGEYNYLEFIVQGVAGTPLYVDNLILIGDVPEGGDEVEDVASSSDGSLPQWSYSDTNVTITNGAAVLGAGGTISMPVTGDYTLTFNWTRSTTGVGTPPISAYMGIGVSSPSAAVTSGTWLYGGSDQNSLLYIDGVQQTGYWASAQNQGWIAQNGQMTLTVSGGVASLSHATHGDAYINFPVGTDGYIVFYTPTSATIAGLGSGSGGGTSVPDTGATQYTQFDEALDTTKWEVSSGASVANSKLTFNAGVGSYLATVGTYTDFVLEFDIYGLKTVGSLITVFAAGDDLNYSAAKYVQHNLDGMCNVNFGAPSDRSWHDPNGIYGSEYAHIRLQVNDGVVTAGWSVNGGGFVSHEFITAASGTSGRVFIGFTAAENVEIDNLVIINSKEYADYTVQKKTLNVTSLQVGAGKLAEGTIDLGDMTDKTANFVATTSTLRMQANGAWEIDAPTTNGTHYYYFTVKIVDLVLGGWIYPLGSRGEYTLTGMICLQIIDGEGEYVEGGGGDTTYVPEYVDDVKEKTIYGGVEEDVTFKLDLKGKAITKVAWYRSPAAGDNGFLSDNAYSYDADFKVFSILGAYAKILPEGATKFTVYTAKGHLDVTVRVECYAAPTTGAVTTATVNQYATDDVSFTVNLNGEELLGIQVEYTTALDKQLTTDAYTLSGTTLTIKGAYLATLAPDDIQFVVNTYGGSVTFTITIIAIEKPEVTGTNYVEVELTTNADQKFAVDLKGQAITQVVVVRGETKTTLKTENYSYTDKEFTLKGAYVATLEAGTTKFEIWTLGGKADDMVSVVVNPLKAPVVSDNQLTIDAGVVLDQYIELDVLYASVTDILGIAVGNGQQLSADAYDFNLYDGTKGELLLKGEFLATLTADTTLTVYTTTGGVEITIVVSAANKPVIVAGTATEKTVKQYVAEDVTFSIDAKGQAVTLLVLRNDEYKTVQTGMYSFSGTTLTLSGSYVATLDSNSTFYAKTDYGMVAVTVKVTPSADPTLNKTGETITQGTATAISVTLNTDGLALNGVQVTRPGVSNTQLSADAYKWANGTFTFKAEYVASLEATTTYTFHTLAGEVSFVITVNAIPAPTISGPATQEVVFGTATADKLFSIDTKNQDITAVVAVRGEDRKQLASGTAYTYASGTLTIKAAYLAVLPVGTTTIEVWTAGGNVSLTITVASSAPQISGLTAFTIAEQTATAVQINLNTFGLKITDVKQGTTELTNDNYTYVGGILTLTAAYTDTLTKADAAYTFTVTTTAGTCTFTVTVVAAPTVDDGGNTGGGSNQGSDVGSGNVWDPNFDWDNWTGDIKPDFNGNYYQGATSDGCSGSVGALSGLALVGAAAVALVLKKKDD